MSSIKRFYIHRIDVGVVLLAAICVCFLSPFIQRTIGTVGVLFIVGVYLVLEINRLFRMNAYDRITAFLILLYIGMLLLYSFLGMSDKGAGQTNCVYFSLIFFVITPIYKYLNRRQCIFIITVCIVTIFVTLAQNYALWVRMGYQFTQQWYRTGIKEVINTQYVAATVYFSGVLFCVFLYKKNTNRRYWYLTMAISCFVFNVVVTQRTIALLLSILMFFLLMLVNGKITKMRLLRYIFFAALLLLAIVEYEAVLDWLANVFNSDRIRKRVNDITSLLTTGDLSEVEEGSMTARIRLIGVSINTFFSSFSNFLFGVGFKEDNLLVGNHSYFFDEFAKFGLFGGLLSCTIVFRMIKLAKRISCVPASDPLYRLMSVIILTMILRSLIGGLLIPSIGVVMFIFAPLTFKILKFDREYILRQ